MKYAIIFFLLIIIAITGCTQQKWQPYSRSEILLGTFVSITSYDSTLEKFTFNRATDSVFSAIRVIENHTNPFDSLSEIAGINSQTMRKQHFVLSPVLWPILKNALEISKETAGAYDPTLWPVFRLWHFGTDSAAVPPTDSLQKYLKLVNYKKISLKDSLLSFQESGMGIDLSGISKGWAVDKARKILLRFGLRNFIVDAGGNLGIEWHSPRPVNIYIRHPRLEGQLYGEFPVLESCGISTSGDYQNYFEQGGTRYHHILDPATGYPARGAVSVTVQAPDAATADGLSTALFVLGAQKALDFINKSPDLEGVVLFMRGDSLQYRPSDGLKDKFVLESIAPESTK